jgi:hypothetical protein
VVEEEEEEETLGGMVFLLLFSSWELDDIPLLGVSDIGTSTFTLER